MHHGPTAVFERWRAMLGPPSLALLRANTQLHEAPRRAAPGLAPVAAVLLLLCGAPVRAQETDLGGESVVSLKGDGVPIGVRLSGPIMALVHGLQSESPFTRLYLQDAGLGDLDPAVVARLPALFGDFTERQQERWQLAADGGFYSEEFAASLLFERAEFLGGLLGRWLSEVQGEGHDVRRFLKKLLQGGGGPGGSGAGNYERLEHESEVFEAAFEREFGEPVRALLGAPAPPPRPPVTACATERTETTTWTLTSAGDPRSAERQVGFGLSRLQARPEGHFRMDEWAVLGYGDERTFVRSGSTAAFQDLVARSAGAYREPAGDHHAKALPAYGPAAQKLSLLLVVEAGAQPHEGRRTRLPVFEPVDIDLGDLRTWYASKQGEIWFRAEVAATGEVDELMVFEYSVMLGPELETLIRSNLKLRYADERRHRAVVFGIAKLVPEGRLLVSDALVVLPRCCDEGGCG